MEHDGGRPLNARDGALDERTPAGEAAGIVTRTTADVVDLLLILAAVLVVYFGIAGFLFIVSPRRFDWPTLSGIRIAAVYWLVLVVYLTGAWSSTGRSIGKQVMGLRVERRGRDPLGIARAPVRAVLSAAYPT